LKETGAQYYLIGPNIDALSSELDEELAASLTKTDFRMVAVDIDDRSEVEAPFGDLVRFLQSDAAESSLVFTGSPGKADRLAIDLVEGLEFAAVSSDGLASAVADWLADAYDQAWTPVVSLKSGIGVHTGPMPRSVQRMMVRLFNDHLMPILICTSTLIEGVNTAARYVVVYDRKIDGQLLDFFTFSNIRGRAGRAFQHFVGRVITYSEPPSADETEVDIPIETQSEQASLAALIQLPESELEDEARTRLAPILEQDELDLEVIRANKGINPERQLDTARAMRGMTREQLRDLSWTGVPNNSQARAVLQLGFTHLLESWQRRGINFEMLWGKLQAVRNNSDNFSEIVTIQERYRRKGESRSDVVTEVLRFQRNWMGFTIPSMLRAVQSIGVAVLPEFGLTPGNYEYMLREVESLYLPPGLVELDEYGIPIPLGIQLMRLGLQGADVAGLLEALPNLVANPRVMSSLSFVEQWIIEDVLEGLGYSSHLG